MADQSFLPRTCFWELTRRCNLGCTFCRVNGGDGPFDELDLDGALGIADQIVALGVKFVVLTGGEPLLYPGWEKIAQRLSRGNVRVRLFTNGYAFDEQVLQRAKDAGVSWIFVSLDGPKKVHDILRMPKEGSSPSAYDRAVATLRLLVETKTPCRVITQVNRYNIDLLPEIYSLLLKIGVDRWRIHLCQMTGRAADFRDALMIEPADLQKIMDALKRAAKDKKILAPLHCSIGYMTAEEPALRTRETRGRPVWLGCLAGKTTFAVTPTGGVKGCVTLPDEFITASLGEKSLEQIWDDDRNFSYTRNWIKEILGGMCLHCAFGNVCKGGCIAVAYGATGSIGANPYCLKLVRED